MKILIDKYQTGENNLPLIVELTLKALGQNESSNVMARLGY